MRKLFGGVALLALVGLALGAANFAYFAVRPTEPGSLASEVIEVRKGEPARDIIHDLVVRQVIRAPGRFLWLGRFTRQWGRVKAGEYKVGPGQNPLQIFATLTSGISLGHPVTVREGENMYEIAADLETKGLAKKAAFLALCRDPAFIRKALGLGSEAETGHVASLEGYLYPNTYLFNRSMTTPDMARQMVRQFQSVWTAADTARARELGWTRHQAVTLASMIEKETGAAQERPVISSVFHNRLAKRMRLQSDPTTIYGIWHRYHGNLHHADLLADSPFNTYTIPALPAGPIANPGRQALEAALHPAQSEYLFFVSHNDGTHQFSRSLAEHNDAVRKFQMDPQARAGKSWRDLPKEQRANASVPATSAAP